MNLLQEITLYGDWYMKGLINIDIYYSLVDLAVECWEQGRNS